VLSDEPSCLTPFSTTGDFASSIFGSSGMLDLTTLSSAGRFASGSSLEAEGDDGSSRGRFCEGAAATGGEADMLSY
jgi:hypothetical protein